MADDLETLLAKRAAGQDVAAAPAVPAAAPTAPDQLNLESLLLARANGQNVAPTAAPKPSATYLGGGFGRGIRDVWDTGAEFLDKGLDPWRPLIKDVTGVDLARASDLDAQNRQQYADAYPDANNQPTKSRIAGQIAGTLPAMAIAPFSGEGWLVRAGNGALQGGAASAMLSSTSKDPLALDMAKGGAWGAGASALLPPAIGYAARGVGALLPDAVKTAASDVGNYVMNKAGAAAKAMGIDAAPAVADASAPAVSAPVPTGAVGLFGEGVTKPRIRYDANGQVIPDMQSGNANAVDFQRAGLTGNAAPSAAQQTRNPQLWTTEQNMAKANPNGPLASKFSAQNQAIQDAVNNIKTGTGGTATSNEEAGRTVTDAIQAKSKEMQDQIGGLYDQIRNSPTANQQVSVNELQGALTDAMHSSDADKLTASVLRKMQSYGLVKPGTLKYDPATGFDFQLTDGAALPVKDAEQLRQFIGNQVDRSNKTQVRVGDALINSLDNDVVNSSGSDAFKAARDAARAKFQEFNGVVDSINSEKINPDDALRKVFLTGKTDQIASLKNSLLTGTQDQILRGNSAFNNIRGQVVDGLFNSAVNEAGKWQPTKFANALDKIGNERLKLIFNPDELAALGSIRRAGTSAFADVPFSAVNHSNSGPYIDNMLKAAGGQVGPMGQLVEGAPLVSGLIKKMNDAMANAGKSQAEQNMANYTPAAAARFTKNKQLLDAVNRLPLSSATAALVTGKR